jgi:hypothetical protein
MCKLSPTGKKNAKLPIIKAQILYFKPINKPLYVLIYINNKR